MLKSDGSFYGYKARPDNDTEPLNHFSVQSEWEGGKGRGGVEGGELRGGKVGWERRRGNEG